MSVDTELSELQVLTTKRGYVRQRVTKIHQKISGTEEANITNSDAYSYSAKIKDLQAQLRAVDDNIFTLMVKQNASQNELQEQVDALEEYEDKLQECLVKIQVATAAEAPVQSGAGGAGGIMLNQQKLKLPEITLPSYSHKANESLEKFFYNFESIIDKHRLSSYEKFLYLRGTLSRSPKTLIDSLNVNEQNYDRAKELLTEAFGSKITQQYEVLRRLADLKLQPNADPYMFIGEMRTITANVKHLGIDVDTVLQFFIWQSLNDKFQDQLITITNKNKPNLAEINENIFAATERYLKVKDKINNQKGVSAYNSTNYAAGINTETSCQLCKHEKKSFTHHIKDCKIFNSALKKIEKLKAMRACTKCALMSHESKHCKYKFYSKCRTCKGSHMSYLCLKAKMDGANVKQTTNNVSTISAMYRSKEGDAIILPTFTGVIQSQVKSQNVRCLNDSGCQRNFIVENKVQALKLKILQPEIRIKVTGFNESKMIKTKVVEVPIKMGATINKIETFSVPEIPISLTLNNLTKVAKEIDKKGCNLADKSVKKIKYRTEYRSISGHRCRPHLGNEVCNFW